jgi:hypothetical protein
MSAVRGIVRKLYHAVPFAPQLRAWLANLAARTPERGRAGGAISTSDESAQRAWLQRTMAANRKARDMAREERLAGPGRDAERRGQELRARDLEDYVRLGGRVPPG